MALKAPAQMFYIKYFCSHFIDKVNRMAGMPDITGEGMYTPPTGKH